MLNLGRNVMNAVKIDRLELLLIVRENKQKHIEDYLEAVEDFKLAAIAIATENLTLATSGDVNQIVKMKGCPTKPVSFENSYTRAIRMLELSVENVISVEEDVFNQLVLDEWTWKQSFTSNSIMYKTLNGSI
jgi:hypothetical protein